MMGLKLSFGDYNNYHFNEKRLSKIMQADKNQATEVSIWDKIKDLFRSDKKEEACKQLYNLLHATDGGDRLDAFNKLKSFATPESQLLFTKAIHHDEMRFYIGSESIAKSDLQSLMSLSEQTTLCPMSESEQHVFLGLLDTLRKKEVAFSDYAPSYIRGLAAEEHTSALQNLYRPEEDNTTPATQWNNPKNVDEKERNLLRYLNKGSMKSLSEFSFMGYKKSGSGVEFSMLHPSINYLLTSYSRDSKEGSAITSVNVGYLNQLNKTYQLYQDDKAKVDAVLSKIYFAHGGTLHIAYLNTDNNGLAGLSDTKISSK